MYALRTASILYLLAVIVRPRLCDETTTDTEIITASGVIHEPENTTTPVLQSSPTQHHVTSPSGSDEKKVFKPSVPVDAYYEFNRFPVPPAHPEPKIFGSVEKVPINSWQEPHITANNNPVRFPLAAHPLTVNDHPYPYAKDVEKAPSNFPGFAHKPTGLSKVPFDAKFGKPSKIFHEEENTELTPSHWKKLIKILTAFIPIGLLISALTPSVITIGPANTTYRARSDDDKPPAPGGILSSLPIKECDERIFCELLLSAEQSKYPDRAVNNMLENYMASNGNPEKLQRIYKAIRNGNCSSLHCDRIK